MATLSNLMDIKAATAGLSTAGVGVWITLGDVQTWLGILTSLVGLALSLYVGWCRSRENKLRETASRKKIEYYSMRNHKRETPDDGET